MNDGIWIGRLCTANHFLSQFDPVAKLVDGAWEQLPQEERTARFPPRGLVRGKPDQAFHNKVGTLWLFDCRLSRSDGDHWSADAPERAMPMLDLSNLTLPEARHCLCVPGSELSKKFVGRQVAVLLDQELCGIFRFEQKAGHVIVRLPAGGLIDLYRADPQWRSDEQFPYLPAKGIASTDVIRRIDWSSDNDFAVRVVTRYRAAVGGYLALLKDVDTPARSLERALADSKLLGPAALELEAVVQRMKDEWPDTARGLAAVHDMSQLLMETDQGKDLLAAAVDRHMRDETAKLQAKLREEAERGLEELRRELDQLEGQVSSKHRELAAIEVAVGKAEELKRTTDDQAVRVQERLTAAQKALDAAASDADRLDGRVNAGMMELEQVTEAKETQQRLLIELERTTEEFVVSVRSEIDRVGAHDCGEVGVFASRIERLLSGGAKQLPPMTPTLTPPWCVPKTQARERIDLSKVAARLAAEAEWHGIALEDLVMTDGFVRAGELLLLVGENAELCLRAYARAVAGGEIRCHALDPSTIGLDDIWRAPTGNRLTAFATAWHRAVVQPDEIVLIVFRDFDAAPFRLWLSSLRAVLASALRPRNLLVAAVAMGRESNEGDGGNDSDVWDLRHFMVALQPRSARDAGRAEVVLEAEPLSCTLLAHRPDHANGISRADFNSLVKQSEHPDSVRRSVQVASTVVRECGVVGQSLAESWGSYLRTGDPTGLPAPLARGVESVKKLAVQR